MSLVGTIFGKNFKLEKLIGEGAFGKVFLAKSLDSSLEVAVKLVTL